MNSPFCPLELMGTALAVLSVATNQASSSARDGEQSDVTVTAVVPSVALKNPDFELGWRGGKPAGWNVSWKGDQSLAYRATLDPDGPHQGKLSARLEFAGANLIAGHHGTLAQGFSAVPYRGKTVQLIASARVRDDNRDHVGLFVLTTDTTGRTSSLQNMTGRPITGSEWADYRVEIFVPIEAREIGFGLLLNGPGPAWIDGVRLRIVPNAQ